MGNDSPRLREVFGRLEHEGGMNVLVTLRTSEYKSEWRYLSCQLTCGHGSRFK